LKQILLINPNSSVDTTAMMVEIAQATGQGEVSVAGITATRSPPMIVTAGQLSAAAAEVIEIGVREAPKFSGIIVSAFGDPGLDQLRRQVSVPAAGLCEASMIEASMGGRRFGIATVTPQLVVPIEQRARDLGLMHLYTGIRLTSGDPAQLAAKPLDLERALAAAVAQCFEEDHAEAVIIGGGPLGQAAVGLARSFDQPIIAPIPAAVRRLMALMERGIAD
jgi:Asp/Glu/hydantoin racemase